MPVLFLLLITLSPIGISLIIVFYCNMPVLFWLFVILLSVCFKTNYLSKAEAE